MFDEEEFCGIAWIIQLVLLDCGCLGEIRLDDALFQGTRDPIYPLLLGTLTLFYYMFFICILYTPHIRNFVFDRHEAGPSDVCIKLLYFS